MFATLSSLGEKRRAIDALMGEWLEEAAAYDRSQAWQADGYWSAATAISDECHMDRGAVGVELKLARRLEQLPVVADAFRAGEISQRHVAVIARAATPERMPVMGTLEGELVDTARKCAPKDLAGIVQYVTDAIDGDGGAGAEERVFARRRYSASRLLDDMLAVDGFFDPESAGVHESALRIARDRDARTDETRTLVQRNADAVTMIMRQWLELTEANTPDHVRRQVVVLIDLKDAPGVSDDLVAQAREERRRDGGLSAATLERIACDAHLSRVIMYGTSEVLDVGRTSRTATNAQFRALIVRDRHCRARGCKEPPHRCQAHHIRHWKYPDNGPTDIDNLLLLCWRHHRERHLEESQAAAGGGGPTFIDNPILSTGTQGSMNDARGKNYRLVDV